MGFLAQPTDFLDSIYKEFSSVLNDLFDHDENPYFNGSALSGFHVLVGFAVTSCFGPVTKK